MSAIIKLVSHLLSYSFCGQQPYSFVIRWFVPQILVSRSGVVSHSLLFHSINRSIAHRVFCLLAYLWIARTRKARTWRPSAPKCCTTSCPTQARGWRLWRARGCGHSCSWPVPTAARCPCVWPSWPSSTSPAICGERVLQFIQQKKYNRLSSVRTDVTD